MISGETIAENIFKILKGNGYKIKIFTDEGENTVDPQAARRFYIPDLGSMVNLDETDSKREIRVSVNQNTDIKEFKDTLALLKNLANQNVIEYTLKSFTKSITPKDQDYQAQKVRDMKQDVQEGISPAYGSSKSSYQQLENAKLIIKHTKPVNEESRGSRSRNISAIYIESADGERYKMETNNLAGGRAMLRHVKEGGNPYDEFGRHISEQCIELKKLKEFKKYSLRNGLVNEDTTDIVEAVSNRINSLREGINKLKGCKCYNETKEKFESKEVKINETDRNKLRNQFTVRTFDESLDEALPYVNALVKEMKAIKEADDFAKETMDSLADTIEKMDTVSLRKGINVKSDPENPMNLSSFGNMPKENQIAVVMEYLGNSIDYAKKGEDQLSQLLTRMSDEMERVKDRAIMISGVQALNSLFKKLTATASEDTSVREDWEETFESNFKNYDFDKLFS
tara:strand:- start:7980 stop:9344 length:1365 start_codon:yes stop_codon:yes gene_type:complete